MSVTEFQSTDLVTRLNVNEKIQQINSLFPVSISQGGTGATTSVQALKNIGIVDNAELDSPDFTADTESDYISQVKAYALAHITDQIPLVFNAGWKDKGYGTAVAFATSDTMKFLMLYNDALRGVRFFKYAPSTSTTWYEKFTNVPTVLYENSSGSAGTITLSSSVSNFVRIGVYAKNRGTDHSAAVYNEIKLSNTTVMSLAATTATNTKYDTTVWFSAIINFSGTKLTFSRNFASSYNRTGGYNSNSSDGFKILRVVGYKY